jgi:cytochrome b561
MSSPTPTTTEAQGDSYSAPAKWFHWLTAVLVLILIPVGIAMTNMGDGPTKNNLYEYHKSFGITVWVIAALRIVYRLAKGAPAPDASLTRFQRVASSTVHFLLYALVFLLPILGFVGTSMCCQPVNLFFTWPMPIRFSGSQETVNLIFTLHKAGGILLAVLVVGHIGAALYHSLVRGDRVLSRMT